MSFLDLALIFFLLLVFLNYRAQRSVLYPPFIFCTMWLLVLEVFRSGLIEVDPVHNKTLASAMIETDSFSVAGLLSRESHSIHFLLPNPQGSIDFLGRMEGSNHEI